MAADGIIKQTQQWLKDMGFYTATVDGIWGGGSQRAMDALKASTVAASHPYGVSRLTWGNKLTDAEIAKVAQVVQRLKLAPVVIQDFMGCMAWESNKTFSPSVQPIGRDGKPISSATGLIQFMAATAKGLGTTTDALAKMSVVEQLEYVYLYFKPYAGKLNNLGDIYMAILYPRGIGQSDDWILFNDGDANFAVNKGLDLDANGKISRLECLHKVNNRLVEGFLAANVKNV